MKRILVGAVIMLAAVGAFAATTAVHTVNLNVNPVYTIALDDASAIDLYVTAPVNAGDAPTGDSDNSKHLRYTIVATGSAGLITVQWGGDMAAPAGTQLQVTAAADVGYGTGSTWTFVNADATAHNFITAIPSCYTSNGGADLHAVTLTYTFSVTNPASLDVSDDQSDTITYTISAS